jgi:hypothetical protein
MDEVLCSRRSRLGPILLVRPVPSDLYLDQELTARSLQLECASSVVCECWPCPIIAPRILTKSTKESSTFSISLNQNMASIFHVLVLLFLACPTPLLCPPDSEDIGLMWKMESCYSLRTMHLKDMDDLRPLPDNAAV